MFNYQFSEGKIIKDLDLKIELPERHPQVVPIRVRPVPGLEAEPRVEVFVVEDDGEAATFVVHVVHLGVAFCRHPSHVLIRPSRHSTAAESPSVALNNNVEKL